MPAGGPKQRSAQAIVLYAMDLEPHGLRASDRRRARCVPARPRLAADPRYLERLAATPDWGEVIVAANLCFEPVVGTLIRRELGIRAAAASGDTVTPVMARVATQEWEWSRAWTVALVRFLWPTRRTARQTGRSSDGWLEGWRRPAREAAAAVSQAAAQACEYAAAAQAQVYALTRGSARPPRGRAPRRRSAAAGRVGRRTSGRAALNRRLHTTTSASSWPRAPRATRSPGSCRPRRGDRAARVLGDPRIHRLVIPYDEVSEELGYEIDAYSIQHEMSTHYGRMVATDDALMLFSDPTEAMEYLMS